MIDLLIDFHGISTLLGLLFVYMLSLVSLFNGISTSVGYLVLNPFLLKDSKLLATVMEGNPKAPFSIATTPRCKEGRYSFPWTAPVYP